MENAKGSIYGLYNALSEKNFEKAEDFYSKGAEDQFNPEFCGQFHKVSVEDLKVVSNSGRILTIQGVIVFVCEKDRTKQIETRLFIIDSNQLTPIIIASKFEIMIEFRQQERVHREQQ